MAMAAAAGSFPPSATPPQPSLQLPSLNPIAAPRLSRPFATNSAAPQSRSTSDLSTALTAGTGRTLLTMFGSFTIALAIILVLLAVPLEPLNQGSNWRLVLLYPGVWTFLYSTACAQFSITAAKEAHLVEAARVFKLWGVVPMGLLNAAVASTIFAGSRAAGLEYPFPAWSLLAVVLGVLVMVAVPATWLLTGRAGASLNSRQLVMGSMSLFAGGLSVGWAIALGFTAIFKQSEAWLQFSLLLVVSVWKQSILHLCKSHFVRQRFQGSDALVAAVAASVTWFWTVYSDIVFSSVQEGWVFWHVRFPVLISTTCGPHRSH